MTPDRFKTRANGNKPYRLTLWDPLTDAATEDWIDIVSVDSDRFANARLQFDREQVAEIGKLRDAGKIRGTPLTSAEIQLALDAFLLAQRPRIAASLVVGTSLQELEDPAALVSFLTEAPQIAEAINRLSADRQVFSGPRRTNS